MSERVTWTNDSLGGDSGGPARGTAGLVLVYARIPAQMPNVIPVLDKPTVIGREGVADVFIPEGAVSRQHARLERFPDGDYITDLGSTNGTLYHGRRIDNVKLAEHDVIRIGDTVYRYAETAIERFAAYRLTGERDLARTPAHGILDPLLIGGMQIDLLLDQIAKIARTMLSVVVVGESGTGKELVARELHRWSRRPGTFQAINCAAIPANLLESELFGYKRGAFTGATQDKVGLVQAANQGTLFLDEIGDMPLEAQAKLLRVLQEREVTPIGATSPVKVDVRIVAATHRDLDAFVAEGKFRGDLLARIREVPMGLPALRHRREDIYPLVRHFLGRHAGKDHPTTAAYMLALMHYDFPYNVRELESAVKLSIAMAEGSELDVRHLPTTIRHALEGHGARGDAASSTTSPLSVVRPASSSPASAFDTRELDDIRAARRVGKPHRDDPLMRTSGAAPVMPSDEHSAILKKVFDLPGASSSSPTTGVQTSPVRLVGDAPDKHAMPTEAELRALCERFEGNVSAMARELGKARMQIHRWLDRYDIDVESYRR